MHKMQLSMLFASALSLASALYTEANGIVNVDRHGQKPIVENCQQITRTKIVTRTSHEIHVVSTVYRTRTHGEHPHPTPHMDFEAEEQRLVFGVEGSGCDRKACTICRMLNNCSNEERDCTSCDLAYYCHQCPPTQLLPPLELEGIRIQKTCSLAPGRSFSCDEVVEAVAEPHKAVHFGGR